LPDDLPATFQRSQLTTFNIHFDQRWMDTMCQQILIKRNAFNRLLAGRSRQL
jgi:hypothetical protein